MDELNRNGNEPNDVIQSAQKHYLLGTLGALIGALVASIPWVLMYVYGNMILSALAILIAIGTLKGYQLFKGTIDKKLPFIISIISLLVVIVVTLGIIPMLLIAKEGYAPTIANFELLYGSEEFLSAIVKDLIVSIAFTILGISGVVSNVNKKIKNSDAPLNEIKVADTLDDSNAIAQQQQNINQVKEIFTKYNAIDKEHTIDKDAILMEFQELENGKQLFNNLKSQQIIRKCKGKYYFSEKDENKAISRSKSSTRNIMIAIVIIFVFAIALVLLDSDTNSSTSKNTLGNTTSQTTKNVTSYSLSDFGMKINVPINMALTTSANDLDYLFGTGASTFYEFALYNEDDLISCFTRTSTDSATVDNYYETLKKSFTDAEYTIVSDLKKETISGFEFTTLESKIESNGASYTDLCLGYFEDDKFVFFEYTYPTENANQARKVMENIIQKVK